MGIRGPLCDYAGSPAPVCIDVATRDIAEFLDKVSQKRFVENVAGTKHGASALAERVFRSCPALEGIVRRQMGIRAVESNSGWFGKDAGRVALPRPDAETFRRQLMSWDYRRS